jgi:hypothetical protein
MAHFRVVTYTAMDLYGQNNNKTILGDGGEVLVSQTVKDLVAGAGIKFIDRGTHTLKGVPDEWRILAVV